MKCSKAKILLSAELDGELSPSEELALTSHLAKCTACAQEKESLTSLRGTMALWTDEEPSEWLAQSFSYKLKDLACECPSPAPQTAPRRRWAIFGSATAGLVTAGLLLVMLAHNQPQQPVTPEMTKEAPVASTSLPETPRANTTPETIAPAAQPNADTDTQPRVVVPATPRKQSAGTRTNQNRRYTAAGMKKTRPTGTAIAATPGPAPAPTPAAVPSFDTDHALALPSRGEGPSSVETKSAIAEITVVGVTKPSPEQSVVDNIGEAGLAMNENVEKIRGTLQEALDLLVSKPPVPVNTSVETDGGSRP